MDILLNKKDENCFIKVDITLERVNFEETPKPILELTIKSVEEKMVSYIPKNEIVKDYIHYQKSQYYFTEIGKNEIGYVNVHFLKGSGQIVAKIVHVVIIALLIIDIISFFIYPPKI